MTYEFENDFPLIIYNNDGSSLNGIKQTIDKLNELEYSLEKYTKIIMIMKTITEDALSYPSNIINDLLEKDIEEFDDYLLEKFNQEYIVFTDNDVIHNDYRG